MYMDMYGIFQLGWQECGNGGAFGTFLERIPGFAIQNIPDSLPRRYRSYKRLHITDLRYVTARLHSRRSYTMRNVYAISTGYTPHTYMYM
jgi:hypothetical protein